MRVKLVIFLFTMCFWLSACNEKFNKEKWEEGDGINYTYRNAMIDDLLKNYHLKNLSYDELVQIIGEPDQKDSVHASYNLIVKYDMIDPIYSKYLNCSFNADSIITNAEVKEWKK